MLPGDNLFLLYFLKNWHESRDQWAPYSRAESLHFGVRTTNHVESHNNILLSQLGKKTKTLKETLRTMRMVQNSKSAKDHYAQHIIRTKAPVLHGHKSTATEILLGNVTDHCIELIQKQEQYYQKVSAASVDKYQTSTEECQCNFFKGVSLPCCHLMFVREQEKLPIITLHDIQPRWTLEYQLDNNEPGQFHAAAQTVFAVRGSRSAPNKEAKYSQTLRICKEICDHVSDMGGKQYEDLLAGLQKVKDLIMRHGSFQVVGISGKNAC